MTKSFRGSSSFWSNEESASGAELLDGIKITEDTLEVPLNNLDTDAVLELIFIKIDAETKSMLEEHIR